MRLWFRQWQALPNGQRLTLGLLFALLLLAQIGQPYPETAWLHHIPTALLLIAAPPLIARWPLTTGELVCVAGFMALHTIGGRWTYSNVPYDAWTRTLFGTALGEAMGWQRNHYDRLVHLMFGMCAVLPFVGIAQRGFGASARVAAVLAVGFSLAAGALYELFEWGLTMMVSPDVADGYNGQQGDIWDAQKDMGLAFMGALIVAMIWLLKDGRWSKR